MRREAENVQPRAKARREMAPRFLFLSMEEEKEEEKEEEEDGVDEVGFGERGGGEPVGK